MLLFRAARPSLSPPLSPSRHISYQMFSKAANNNAAAARPKVPALGQNRAEGTILSHLKSTQQTSPLKTSTGNAVKLPAQTTYPGFKRTTSSLTRALSQSNGFEEQPLYPTLPKPKAKVNSGFTFEGIQFDENDFPSSDDLEIEEALSFSKPLDSPIKYPEITTSLPAKDALVSSQPIPWTSSPDWHKTAHTNNPVVQPKPLHTPAKVADTMQKNKKRRLPTFFDEEDPKSAVKPKVDQNFVWNMTHSAMKQQQKTLRDSKKRVKTTETPESIADAIEQKKRSTVARLFLSDEQQAVLSMVVDQGKSIFFTGSAGTGKSVLLREIIATLRKKHAKESDRIAITASTGLAACNIGGTTLHSFAGIGLGNSPVPDLVKKIKRNQKAKHRWARTKILIIDEISMVDGELLDKLEDIARQMKRNGRPFGGIQVIITGDFFQLPPVPDRGTSQARFAFNANCWKTVIDHTIALHKVFRQKDPEFAAILNQMREGRLDAKAIAKFKQLSRELDTRDGLEATELFPTRVEVERANQMRLNNLQGETRIYEAKDDGSITDKTIRDKILSNLMAPERIALKKGSQVMLIKNFDDSLVNGSLGKVIGFMSENQWNNYHEAQDFESTQGGTLLEDDIPGVNRNGKVTIDVEGTGAAQRFPVVRFALADGTTRDFHCKREKWTVEGANNEVQASRAQVPLILAWALSIHKAQGQTLEKVKVNLTKAFEKGQAYVALSRATSMNGLQVIGFDASKVQAHEVVRRFYAGLSKMEELKGISTTKQDPVASKETVTMQSHVEGNSSVYKRNKAAIETLISQPALGENGGNEFDHDPFPWNA